MNVSSASAWAPRPAWSARPVGAAPRARRRRPAGPPPARAAGSRGMRAGVRHCSGAASFRSPPRPRGASGRSRRPAVRRAGHFRPPIARIASATDCPCETRTSACRSLATASSGRCSLLAISVLLRFEPIPEGGPLRRGRLSLMLVLCTRPAICAVALLPSRYRDVPVTLKLAGALQTLRPLAAPPRKATMRSASI